MVDITVVELSIEDGSFSANLPFSGLSDEAADDEYPEDDAAAEKTADDDGGGGKGLAVLGVLLVLVVGTAVVKYLTGEDDETDVAIETEGESQTVAAE